MLLTALLPSVVLSVYPFRMGDDVQQSLDLKPIVVASEIIDIAFVISLMVHDPSSLRIDYTILTFCVHLLIALFYFVSHHHMHST